MFSALLNWSKGRPLWQRDALRRIVLNGGLDLNDLDDLTELCKAECGGNRDSLRAVPLDETHLPSQPDGGASIALGAIAKVEGVNNLAADQTLVFAQRGLSIIYGRNGSGKSGYTRVLKRACRARSSDEIVSNIYAPGLAQPPSAILAYTADNKHVAPVEWSDNGKPHAVLSSISVFDSDCAAVYLSQKNEVAFRPFGSDIPDKLVEACQLVRERVSDELAQLANNRNMVLETTSWRSDTKAGMWANQLTHESDLAEMRVLMVVAPSEQERLKVLRRDLAVADEKEAAERALLADNIDRLIVFLQHAESVSSSSTISNVLGQAWESRVLREAANAAIAGITAGDWLPGVGGDAWRKLWESARQFSQESAYPGRPFPVVGDDVRCVLCHQLLSQSAKDRLLEFDDFVRRDIVRRADEADRQLGNALSEFEACDVSVKTVKSVLREVRIHDGALARRVRRFLAAVRLRRSIGRRMLGKASQPSLPEYESLPLAELRTLAEEHRRRCRELRSVLCSEERRVLEAELNELVDRSELFKVSAILEAEVIRLRRIKLLQRCVDSTGTAAITRLGNEVADMVLTPALQAAFETEVKRLAADSLKVELIRVGGRLGTPYYQVRLKAKADARVKQVLSEGERTCVALVCFLTELSTAGHRSALVFDDPVTSLDHRWRNKVARRLVEEAGVRQVIVFTHDLVFANDLYDLAVRENVGKSLCHLSRGLGGAGVVGQGLPWQGQSLKSRLDELGKEARAAKVLQDSGQEEQYHISITSIYSRLRATWERAIEDVVFARVVLRYRDYVDTKHLRKVTVLNAEDCASFSECWKKVCDLVDAHDPSSARNASVPAAEEVLADIQQLKQWVESLLERQRNLC